MSLARRRLIQQQIALPSARHPAEVVASLGAMQAQDYLGALWAVGLRLSEGAEATEATIEQALAEGAFIRTWPMRGTLHFVAPEDARWMLRLSAPRLISGSAARRKLLELDDTIFKRCEKLFGKALRGGGCLSREEMYAVLERGGVSVDSSRGYHILWRLSQEGLLCFGPRSGKQATFVLLDEWAPRDRRLDEDEAVAELARRYFKSHGPATLQDFVWWSGLTTTAARAGIEAVSGPCVKETISGVAHWMAAEARDAPDAGRGLHLPPGFDEYLLGYKNRAACLAPEHANHVNPSSNGMFMGTVVKDGRVIGTWRRVFRKKSVVVTGSPFAAAKKTDAKAFALAAARYGRFLGLPVETQYGTAA